MKFLLSVAAVFALLLGCEESGLEVDQSYASEDVVCDNLYQGESTEEAIVFIGVPEDARKSRLGSIEGSGKLASKKELEFANKVLKVGRSRSVEDFTSLLSKRMQEIMRTGDKESVLWERVHLIKEGHYLDSSCEEDFHGRCDAKFLVMVDKLDKNPAEGHRHLHFPEIPTHKFTFFHFHKPNYMLIGSTVYMVEEGSDYKIVVESLKDIDMPAYPKMVRVLPVTVSGIEKKTAYEYFGKPCEQWHVALTDADNKNNIIEIVKTSRVIKGEKKLEDDQAKEVVVDYEEFEKYAKAWDDVRFKFSAAIEPKSEHSFGLDIGGFKYIRHIASGSIAGDLKYPGMEITGVSVKEKGAFINGELELFTFDSLGADGVVYRNRVFVRLTLKEPRS